MDTATRERWALLGRLFRARRVELGYLYRPAFAEARLPKTPDGNLMVRALNAIENSERPGTYAPGRLEQFARAYKVTDESVYAVLRGEADELTPAGPAVPAALPVPGEPPGWMADDEPPAWMADDEGRSEAARPYADRIRGRLDMLRAQGIRAPSGAQLFPDSPADARDWDEHPDWEVRDRRWFVADLQRRADGRAPDSGTASA